MLKKIAIVFMAIVMLVSAAGCDTDGGSTGGKKEETTSTNSSAAESTVDSNSSVADTSSDADTEDDNTEDADTSSQEQAESEPAEDNNSSLQNDSSESSEPKTVTTTVPKKERPVTEQLQMKKEYTLEGDTTVKDELKFGKFKYVWGDEFNEPELNLNKWDLEADLDDLYDVKDDAPVVMQNGCLDLVAKRYYDPNNDSIKYSQSYHVTTIDTMTFRHGYLEFRAKVPLKKGMWPSVWFQSKSWGLTDNTEIEKKFNIPYMIECNIFEVHGDLDLVKPNIHKWYKDGSGLHTQAPHIRNNYTYEDTTFLPEEYHIYGFLWTDEEISMFIDGEKYNKFDLSINFDNRNNMYGFTETFWQLRLENDIISPANAGADAVKSERMDEYEPGDMPAIFSFDWIRLYQCYDDGTGSAIKYKDDNGKIVSLP